ncbi:hypothetical protein AVEN_71328-1 [Araneus ventricosus]|uniref:Uncharacterized protein n=1 Tax=Araneus ventricosus TaxID=182803 RepID=A0A4Y2BJZ3_ARAVE|nr:hypothetical protein AVEN_71328-1 [Araneus ventricosus]
MVMFERMFQSLGGLVAVSTFGSDDHGFETRFHCRFMSYVDLLQAKSFVEDQTSSCWCEVKIWKAHTAYWKGRENSAVLTSFSSVFFLDVENSPHWQRTRVAIVNYKTR